MTQTVLLILAAVAAAALLLFGRRDRARRVGLDGGPATARRRMEAAAPRLSQADIAEAGRLVAAGRKIEAIRLVREKTGLGLKEAKEFVEHADFGGAPAPASHGQPWATEESPAGTTGPWAAEEAPMRGLSPADMAGVARALAEGRKTEAIRLVREKTGLGLKEAKDFVEGRDVDGKR